MACEFCDVIDGRADGPPRAFENDRLVVFVNRHRPSNALVVTRSHVADLDAGDPIVQRVGRAMERAFDGVTATTVVREDGNGHPHLHVVPSVSASDGDAAADADAQARALADALTMLRIDDVRARPDVVTIGELLPFEVPGLAWSGGPLHLQAVAGELARPPSESCYLVVRAPDGVPVAKGAIEYAVHPGAGWLWQLCTMEPLRSLGLGTALIAEAEARIRARGLERAALGVEDPRARSLYERLGYEPYGTQADGWDTLDADGNVVRYNTVLTLMRKRLS